MSAIIEKLIIMLNVGYFGIIFGGVAHLGERLNGIQEVVGSIPIVSTTKKADKHNVYRLFACPDFECFLGFYWNNTGITIVLAVIIIHLLCRQTQVRESPVIL